jgi:lipid-binding SYLF domain-containing protein
MAPRSLPALALAVTLGTASWTGYAVGGSQSDEADRVRTATTVFTEIMDAPDAGIPRSVLDRAEAVAVFPSVLKGGFVFGGQYGHGILSVRDRESHTWSAPAFLSLTGGSFGAQIGGQAVDLVLVIMNRRGLDQLLRNQFKIGLDAAAAAGPVGRNVAASTDIQLRAEILSYSRSRGLFVGVTIDGASVRQDQDANMRFYGKAYTTRQIVMERLGGAPEPVAAWRDMLGKYF